MESLGTKKGTALIPLYACVIVYGLIAGLMINRVKTGPSYDEVRLYYIAGLVILTAAVFVLITRYISSLFRAEQISTSGIICLIIFSGFIIRLLYITFSTIYMRQNDVLGLYESGHLGYIAYVYVFGKPPIPGSGWEYTQPPLWYYICTLWLKTGFKYTDNFDMLLESLQTISLIFSVGIMIVCDRIALELKHKDKSRIIACLFGAFYPYMIFMSGAINNDCLATFLSMLTILYALKWISSLKFSHLTLTALFFGLSLFAKFSSIILGPALAAIIIMTFVKHEKSLKVILEYAVFAIISSVIGLSWPLYSRIGYGIPFGYINSASEAHKGNHAVWELLFSFKNQLNHYYLNVVEDHVDYDFNIFTTIVKSGTFGVDNFMSDNPILRTVGIILFRIDIALALYLVVMAIMWGIKSRRSPEIRVFFSLTMWVSIILLYGRAIYSAYTCNMELRFMLPAFLMMIFTAGMITDVDRSDNIESTDTQNSVTADKAATGQSDKIQNIYRTAVIVMSMLSVCMWLIVLTIKDYETIRIVIGS